MSSSGSVVVIVYCNVRIVRISMTPPTYEAVYSEHSQERQIDIRGRTGERKCEEDDDDDDDDNEHEEVDTIDDDDDDDDNDDGNRM